MNRQLAFDTAYRGVVAQGGPSVSLRGCAYRGYDGRKCGVGHLISDGAYHRNLEGQQATWPSVQQAISAEFGRPYTDSLFLRALQSAHDDARHLTESKDDAAFLTLFTSKMCELADKFNLEKPQ